MVGMSDPRILKLFHDEYGGNIQFYESKTIKHKDAWMWYATGNTLEKLLVDVMPYLIIKKPQAEIVLELRNSMKTHVHFVRGKKGTQCVPQDIMEYRQGLKNKINFLNRTGKADICLAS
jgi:hypothetical protein